MTKKTKIAAAAAGLDCSGQVQRWSSRWQDLGLATRAVCSAAFEPGTARTRASPRCHCRGK